MIMLKEIKQVEMSRENKENDSYLVLCVILNANVLETFTNKPDTYC